MAARIVLAGGGTAGHLFPAVAVAEQLALLDEQADILLVGAESDRDSCILAHSGLSCEFVSARPFPYRLGPGMVSSCLALMRSTVQALRLLRRFRPSVVFGTGGYVHRTVMLASALLRVPRVTYIGDAYPDRTGRLLSRGARAITLAFEAASQYLPRGRAIHTGAPVRQQILASTGEQGVELLGLERNGCTILVVGGSQGARSINQALLAALPVLLAERGLQIVHLTGQRNYENVSAAAHQLGAAVPSYRCRAFLEQMGAALAAADLVVSRAGSSGIGEATALGKPLILVPYPHAAGHQNYNAAEVQRAGAAVVIADADLSGEVLAEAILGLYHDAKRREAMAQASRQWGTPEAARQVAELLLALQ